MDIIDSDFGNIEVLEMGITESDAIVIVLWGMFALSAGLAVFAAGGLVLRPASFRRPSVLLSLVSLVLSASVFWHMLAS